MASYLFDDPFGELVARGHKTQTIRRLHPDLPKVGEALQLLRYGAGAKTLRLTPDPVCTSVQPIRIYRDVDGIAVDINYIWQEPGQVAALAQADGFHSVGAFFAYFMRRGLPYKGVLIKWAAQEVAEIPRPESPHTPPPVRECGTCRHEGNSIEDWPCRTSMNAAGLICWEPKEAHNGTAST